MCFTGGLCVITSCNFTREELVSILCGTSKFRHVDSLRYNTFSYGGSQGSCVVSESFVKLWIEIKQAVTIMLALCHLYSSSQCEKKGLSNFKHAFLWVNLYKSNSNENCIFSSFRPQAWTVACVFVTSGNLGMYVLRCLLLSFCMLHGDKAAKGSISSLPIWFRIRHQYVHAHT